VERLFICDPLKEDSTKIDMASMMASLAFITCKW